MDKFTYLKGQNAPYIEEMYQRYQQDPDSIEESWRFFFEGMELVMRSAPARPAAQKPKPVTPLKVVSPEAVDEVRRAVETESGVGQLIQAYRELGIHLARINPLEEPLEAHPLLELSSVGLDESDLDRKFAAARLIGFEEPRSLREILEVLRKTYCGPVGVEFTHIKDPFPREWLRLRMETARNQASLDRETKRRILSRLTDTEGFERFLHTRYVAQKRFSIEGADALVPMLDCLIDQTAELGATDLVLGMAHRGRLNVLANVFGKSPEYIFSEFEGGAEIPTSEGDVKYHKGYSSETTTPRGRKVDLTLAFNPSHLEFVNPVVEGMAYAKQSLKGLEPYEAQKTVVPVLIHGDAAYAGQGVVYETMQLSRLRGYATGGTIHIVVNNQIGFTTTPGEARSTPFATDLGKMLQTPILHVNGDDAEAAYYVMQLAAEYRQSFHRDIVIDLVCYRKYGHNEGDEPSFTQPVMYKKIKSHPTLRQLYLEKLEAEGAVTADEAAAMVNAVTEKLSRAQTEARSSLKSPRTFAFEGPWKGLRRPNASDLAQPVRTAVEAATLLEIARKLNQAPEGFHVHPKLTRLLAQRLKQVEEGAGIDWGTGEALAFGSLLWEGIKVRLSGQDSERGTFSHRHSVLYDYENNDRHVPLNHLKDGQNFYHVYNSPLSEAAVLGFDWGYSLIDPKTLVIWEAQFGDFVNGAQVIVDQFITSSESKWQRPSGLVMFLPHGYEGQGPEHSSARLERFLQLAAQQNIQVCNFTTPAQLFHGLRRQMLREFRKPLVVMTPKSLLRHPSATSKLEDFTDGAFFEVIDDRKVLKNARRIVFCSGKVYYDLEAERNARNIKDIAIVRVEQLYPWPRFAVRSLLTLYHAAREIVWAQEEPRNQGAWNTAGRYLHADLGEKQKLFYVGRSPSASPAVGSAKVHERQQRTLIDEALSEEALK